MHSLQHIAKRDHFMCIANISQMYPDHAEDDEINKWREKRKKNSGRWSKWSKECRSHCNEIRKLPNELPVVFFSSFFILFFFAHVCVCVCRRYVLGTFCRISHICDDFLLFIPFSLTLTRYLPCIVYVGQTRTYRYERAVQQVNSIQNAYSIERERQNRERE